MADKPITPKQQRFVDEYLIDLNATQAAIRAGYSKKTAEQGAAQLLSNIKVSSAIAVAQAERSKKTGIDAEWVLTRLFEEATADIADLYDENNNLKPVHEWPEVWRMGLVSGIDTEQLFEGRGESREHVGHVNKLKLSERIKRVELIGKHVNIKAFIESKEIGGREGAPPIKFSDIEVARRLAFALEAAGRDNDGDS